MVSTGLKVSKQSKNKILLVVSEDSHDGLRLAARFLIELGRPARFDNEGTLMRWAGIMDELLSQSGLDYDEFPLVRHLGYSP